MFETIILVIILCVCAVNLITSLEQNDIPQHNAMDKYNADETYNALDAYNDMEIVVERLKKLEDKSPVNWDSHIHDISVLTERLKTLEDKFTYHIQSTDELKPKA